MCYVTDFRLQAHRDRNIKTVFNCVDGPVSQLSYASAADSFTLDVLTVLGVLELRNVLTVLGVLELRDVFVVLGVLE